MSLTTGETQTHSGGVIVVQVVLNSGTAAIEGSVGGLPFAPIKTVTDPVEFVRVQLNPGNRWRVVLTADAVAAI
jgi:hypothetical protein